VKGVRVGARAGARARVVALRGEDGSGTEKSRHGWSAAGGAARAPTIASL
jgi:hypothetical protein